MAYIRRRRGGRLFLLINWRGKKHQKGLGTIDPAAAARIKIPARSPNHNAVVERFQGIMLQECWRPAFHRLCFGSIRQLQREADAWLHTYNNRRRNHGDYMAGRRPTDLLELFS